MFIYIHTFIHSPGLKCIWLKHHQTRSLGLLKLSAGGARIVLSVFVYPLGLSPWSHEHADTNSKKQAIGLGSSHQANKKVQLGEHTLIE